MRARPMITAKLRPPPPASVLIERPRVQAALERAADGHRMILLVAGAGTGKTTEAARFLERRRGRTAWLSVDASDRASGRFVSYLATALGKVEPALQTMVQELLADGMLAEDCAALLAERLGQGWTIVIDDLHHLEPDAQALGPLRTFVRGLPADALTVLVSRRIPSLDLSSELLRGSLSGVFDADLAFDLDETHALLEARRLPGDAEAVCRATGGWVAGIVFEALRRPEGSSGLPLERGPALLLPRRRDPRGPAGPHPARPAPDGRCSTPSRRVRLGRLPREEPPVLLDELARLHLPATAEPGVLRYHPQFREFLEHRLTREMPREVPGAPPGVRPAARGGGLPRGGRGRAPAKRPVRRGRGAGGDRGHRSPPPRRLGQDPRLDRGPRGGEARRRPILREVQARACSQPAPGGGRGSRPRDARRGRGGGARRLVPGRGRVGGVGPPRLGRVGQARAAAAAARQVGQSAR